MTGRPKRGNPLSRQLARDLVGALLEAERMADIHAIVVAGTPAHFSVGADLAEVHGMTAAQAVLDDWLEEFDRFAHARKPTIAAVRGYAVGGGFELALSCDMIVCAEDAHLALPETGIGFFPDVGASWFLTRQPGEGGTYLGLTGEIVGAGDVMALGLADHFMASDRREALIEALAAAGDAAQVAAAIARLAAPAPAGTLAPSIAAIDRLFAYDRIEAIIAALEADDSDFAGKTLATLKTKSPRSLHVTLRLLRLGRQATRLEDCLEREFAATDAVLANPDFYEGVRAAVIDKDRNPRWRPATLDAVSEADIAAFFPSEHERLFSG